MQPHDLPDLLRTRRLLAIVRGDDPAAALRSIGAGTVLTARDAAALDLVGAA
ncbi:hypothetical protein [Microbispora bryophytorum]|uniref:hypothetical protein n=1 Tax=Microbispora bryophytorum TaxID=1460882 RepID=UPI00143101EF|nr:hypothetical protein [Microbispora bryophytorum]MBD3138904.1 hypothetical protein [Microbispora bryophytorum]